jgi:hypothetical protein
VTSPAALVNKVRNYAHVLRDDGVSYGDYVEQIACLLFLKMDQEHHDHLGDVSRIPVACHLFRDLGRPRPRRGGVVAQTLRPTPTGNPPHVTRDGAAAPGACGRAPRGLS